MKLSSLPCSLFSWLIVCALAWLLVEPLGAQDINQTSPTKDQPATPTDTKSPHKQVRDIGLFRPLWYGEALNLNYLLEELNIVGYQCAELKRIAARTRKEADAYALEFHNEQVKRGEMFSQFDDPVWMEKQLSIQKKLVDGLKDALLPGQLEDLRQVLEQRNILKSKSIEPFVLPFQVAHQIGMEQKARDELQKKMVESFKEFQSSKTEIFQKAWAEIQPVVPGESTSGMLELLELVEGLDKFDSSAGKRDAPSMKSWTKDNFQRFENGKFQDAVVYVAYHDPLKKVVDLQDYQTKAIAEIVERINSLRIPDDFIDPGFAAIIEKTPDPNGNLKALKVEIARKLKIAEELRTQMTNKIVSGVLLPHQTKKLKRIAKFSRLVFESKYGDEFGVVVAWSKTFNDPNLDEAKLIKTVETARNEFYSELKELRKQTGNTVMAAMSIEAKTKFTSVYGDQLYDYQSEKVASWDEFRKSSK